MMKRSLEKRIDRIEAYIEIQNLMGKYEYFLSAAMGEEVYRLFALKSADVSANIGDWGVYKGEDGIKRQFIEGFMKYVPKEGWLAEADLTTPIIEVSGDCKTAKGAWTSPGVETNFDNTGKPHAGWCWIKYACDFIKEEGEWKIWHLNCFLTFSSDYYKSWAEGGDIPKEVREGGVPLQSPDAPNPYPHYKPYDPHLRRGLLPAFPYPYETFNAREDWIDTGN